MLIIKFVEKIRKEKIKKSPGREAFNYNAREAMVPTDDNKRQTSFSS